MNEKGEEKVGKEEDIAKIENKESPEELPVLTRFTKEQVQELYDLFEQEKSLEEISKIFEEKYKCRPLSKKRLRNHLYVFRKLKKAKTENDEGDNHENDKAYDPETSSEITNEDIQEMNERMFSTPESLKKEKPGSGSSDSLIFGLDMKWVIIAAVAVAVIIVILLLRRKEENKEPEAEPEPKPEPKALNIKWV